jgi:hypothetical protein
MRLKRIHWPLIGMTISLCLFVAAAARYPGGTTFSAHSLGYDWSRNFISSLFRPTAINGDPNPARFFAIPGLAFYCLSLAFIYWNLASHVSSGGHRKMIQIAGVGSAVYAMFIATPMHDLMVTISLLFSFTVTGALLHVLYIQKKAGLLVGGLFALLLCLAAVVMYYGNMFWELLPIVQKSTYLASVAWLLALYYQFGRAKREVPN